MASMLVIFIIAASTAAASVFTSRLWKLKEANVVSPLSLIIELALEPLMSPLALVEPVAAILELLHWLVFKFILVFIFILFLLVVASGNVI